MWQSITRILFALLITAVGASLLIGTVGGEGPVPNAPPEAAEPPPLPPNAFVELPVQIEITTTTTAGRVHTASWTQGPGVSIPSTQAITNGLAMSASGGCSDFKVTRSWPVKKYWSATSWCWDGTYITGNMRIEADGEGYFGYSFNKNTEKRFTHGGVNQRYARDTATGQFCTGPYIAVCEDYVTIKKEVKGDGNGKKL